MTDRILALVCCVHFFPAVLIVLDCFAAIRYAMAGDYGRVVYWIAAGMITFAATFLIRH